MSAIKNFYHDEICNGMLDAEDDAYQAEVFLAEEAEQVEAQIAEFEKEQAEIDASGVPSHFHSKF